MAKVAVHPPPNSQGVERRGSPDSVDRELDWLISRDDTGSQSQQSETKKGTDHNDNVKDTDLPNHYDSSKTYHPRSPRGSPRGSPRSPPPPVMNDNDGDDLRRSPRPESRQHNTEDEDEDELAQNETDFDMSEMTDDQRQAMMELHNMKLDLAYTDEEPPEYDVTERLRQLNAELAQDPTPDDERERAIKFDENPVSLVVPPPDYEEGDEEATDQAQMSSTDSSKTSKDPKAMNIDGAEGQTTPSNEGDKDRDDPITSGDADHSEQDAKDSDTTSQERRTSQDSDFSNHGQLESQNDNTDNQTATESTKESNDDDGDQDVLVERNGKYEVLRAKDLTAEERQLYGVETEEDKHTQQLEPHPPSEKRPSTAAGSHSRKDSKSNQKPRAQSASPKTSDEKENYEYHSPYGLTKDEKKQLAKEQRDKKKQDQEEERKRKKKKVPTATLR